jgi:hypothetical protein
VDGGAIWRVQRASRGFPTKVSFYYIEAAVGRVLLLWGAAAVARDRDTPGDFGRVRDNPKNPLGYPKIHQGAPID